MGQRTSRGLPDTAAKVLSRSGAAPATGDPALGWGMLVRCLSTTCTYGDRVALS